MYRALVGMLDNHIQKFEVTHVTERTLFYKSHRGHLQTSREGWFDRFKDAQEYLIAQKQRRIAGALKQLRRLESEMAELEGLTEDGQ